MRRWEKFAKQICDKVYSDLNYLAKQGKCYMDVYCSTCPIEDKCDGVCNKNDDPKFKEWINEEVGENEYDK